ncbi:MAG: YraN family protein [Xanthomonadales bacterium]|nr:YraN family protein [Xanthomonadales bacterium]
MRRRRETPRAAGSHYEELALAHLEGAGLRLLTRNFTCRLGELDLVMRDGEVLVFVEVRYRRNPAPGGFGDGVESVGTAKRMRLVRAAGMFLAAHPRLANQPCRFDVVAISGAAGAEGLDWRRNAFDAS